VKLGVRKGFNPENFTGHCSELDGCLILQAAEKGFLEIARLLVLSDENIINIKDSRGRVAADVLKVNKNDELWEGFASLLQNKT